MILNKDFLNGIKLFNSGNYFECHEFLESLWKNLDDDNSDKKLYQGIIQCAVALHLIGEGRFSGARKVYERAQLNMINCKNNVYRINVENLLLEVGLYVDHKGKFKQPQIILKEEVL